MNKAKYGFEQDVWVGFIHQGPRRVEQDNSNGSCYCLENPTSFANG